MRMGAVIIIGMSCCFLTISYGNDVTSKTALANSQAPFSSVSPELIAGFRLDRTYACHDIRHGALQVALFGGSSTHGTKEALAHYFFPHGKTCLSVADDSLQDNFAKEKDLLAQNFNVFTKNGEFRSVISIAPQQSVVGCGVHWRQCFLRDPLKGNGIWASLSAPLVQVRNRMNLEETILNAGDGPDESVGVPAYGSMKKALIQADWLFGKIGDKVMTKTALGDIEAKVGYDYYLSDESARVELYGGIIIPTSNKHKGEFVFEPIVGRGGHAGLMAGGSFGKDIWMSYGSLYILSWELASHGEYLFKNTQTRSCDLVDKPWSRYIPLYATKEQAQEAAQLVSSDPQRAANLATPGINILTRHVHVTPGLSYDMNTAFVVRNDRVRVEVGYNLFFKRCETVSLACPWEPVTAIKYTAGQGQTNPIRTISGNKYLEQTVVDNSGAVIIPVSLNNFDQSVVQEADLDLGSASTPTLWSNTVYAAGGMRWDDRRYPLLIDGGLSYTFSHNNAVVSRWLLWIKGGLSF